MMTVYLQVPLPFGYHLDLDFLRVCSDELVSGETLQKLKELKRQRRKERKQLEALMGITQVLPKNNRILGHWQLHFFRSKKIERSSG